jgi:UDP-N-acetylmuramoyl-tripeptide--D-alanyl-D-alanine ligase
MEPLKIAELVLATDGECLNMTGNINIDGICTDSRKIKPGELFIPIIGENFDGHDFIEYAIRAGSVAVLSDRYLKNEKIPYIKVKNTTKALLDIAGYYRTKFEIPAIAITGSSGKTTAKDMIAAVLGQSFNVLKNEGNFNNAIGLPGTIFNLNKNHEICVLEMGMNSFGEIRQLAKAVKPDIAVITNIGTAHIEFLKTQQGILKAKLEIIEFFNKNNTLIINGDDELLKSERFEKFNVMRFGMDETNDIYAYAIKQTENKGTEFSVKIGDLVEKFFIPMMGIHNVYNGLSAITVGICLGMSLERIKSGLLGFKPPDMRMESIILDNGMTIINDAYNANPESMKAAIKTLHNMICKNRKLLILGDMMELGEYTEKGHYEVGKYAATNGIDALIAIGERSKKITEGAIENGLKEVYHFENNEKAKDELIDILKPSDTVLVKGSRSVKLEEIVYFLRERR